MPYTEINNRLTKLLAKADTDVAKLLKRSESALIRNYKVSLENIKKEIAAMYEKYGQDVKFSDMMVYNRLTNLENAIADEIKSLTSESIKTTTSAIKNIYSENYYQSGYAIETTVGMKLGFGMLNPSTIQAAVLNPLDRIKWPDRMKEHSQKYMSQIRQELTQGLIQGKGYAKIAKAVTEKTGITANNALRIIRTEGHRVQSASRLLSFGKSETAGEDLGIQTSRVWVATLDDRVRDSHASMDGQAADENGVFTSSSGATAEAPGLFGVPEEDINCRCTVRLEIGDMKPNSRRDNTSKEIISYQNYQEWYDGRILKK